MGARVWKIQKDISTSTIKTSLQCGIFTGTGAIEMSIEKANFRMIEAELYCYKESKKELELLREEIIESSPGPGENVQSGLGDTTKNKAIKLTSSREILEIQRRLTAIEKAIEILENGSEQKKFRLLRMKYFDRRFTDIGIQMELDISERTFYRWRREIVELIANYLGCRV